jgi:hypothetical protein
MRSLQNSPKSIKTVRFTDKNLFREIINVNTVCSETNLFISNSNEDNDENNLKPNNDKPG